MPRGQFRNRLSPEEMNRGVVMLECGVSQRRVAGILNVSQSVVSRMWNRHLTHENPSHRNDWGRDRATTPRQDRVLLIQCRRQRFLNATRLNNEFRNGTGVRISTQIVRNRLHELGLCARRPAVRVPLTRQHVQDRLDRATTPRQDRVSLIQCRRQRFLNATRLNNEFRNETGVRISTQIVRNRLHEFGLCARRPALRVPLTRQHVQDRLDFASTHVRWTIRDWTPVLFTDESRFCLH